MIKKYFGLIILCIVLGCSQKSNENATSLTDFPTNNQATALAIPKEVENFLDKTLKVQKINDCKLVKIVIHDKTEIENFCLDIISAELKDKEMFIVIGGKRVDENFEAMDAHVESGAIKLMVITNLDKQIQLKAESKFLSHGVYGAPPTDVKLIQFGRDPSFAWKIADGDTHQGYAIQWLSVYLNEDRKITKIISVPFSEDNEGACGLESDLCEYASKSLKMQLKYVEKKQLPFLSVEKTEIKGSGKKKKVLVETCVVEIEEKSQTYRIPERCGGSNE